MSQCIGKNAVGGRCKEMSPTDPPHPEHPGWPYLCTDCANAPARKGSRNSNGIVLERHLKTA